MNKNEIAGINQIIINFFRNSEIAYNDFEDIEKVALDTTGNDGYNFNKLFEKIEKYIKENKSNS